MKKGQILLITVMMLATVMTIVLSASFKSVTETQVTKLEEENQKALAAAESAIEAALKENATATIGTGSLTSISGFSGSATIESLAATTFITHNIDKDGSYTFYLGAYDMATKTIGGSEARAITVCFESGSPNPAIEVTLVKTSGVKKFVADPNADQAGRVSNADNGVPVSTNCPSGYSYSINVPGPDATGIGTDGKFLLVRVLFAPTKLVFYRTTTLPVQGRTISSSVTSSTSIGVSKKVVLFQSYPQIPGEFFTTTF
jgi:type II secretory pathway pseudopilin PulG